MATLFAMQAKRESERANFEQRVRDRIRQIRREQQLTLKQVAERANIDVSALSRLESGKRRLALDHIPTLASALGVSTDHILGNGTEGEQDPRVRSDPEIINTGLTKWRLTHRGNIGNVRAYRLHVSERRTEPPATLAVHEGNDWMYVLSGTMRLILGAQDLTIPPGEAVEFDTWTPHWFGAVDGPVELLVIFGPHGDQEHLHE